MPRLGELAQNREVLDRLRSELASSKAGTDLSWTRFQQLLGQLKEACEQKDLEAVVAVSRGLKNKLRRPSMRKALAILEAEKPQEKVPAAPEKKKDGKCSCAKCGSRIEDSTGECIEGSLCPKCAVKSKGKSDQEKEKGKGKGAEKTSRDDTEKMGESSLRRRGY